MTRLRARLWSWSATALALMLPLANTVLGRRWLALLLPLAAPRACLATARRHADLVVPLLAWAAWCALSAAWSPHPRLTLTDAALDVLLPLGAFLALAHQSATPGTGRQVAWAIVASLGLLAATQLGVTLLTPHDALTNKALREGWLRCYPGPGFASTAAALGLALLPALETALAPRRPWHLRGSVIALALLTIALSLNRMAWPVLALLALGWVVLTRHPAGTPQRGRKILALGAAMALCVLALVLADASRQPTTNTAPPLDQFAASMTRDPRVQGWSLWAGHAADSPWVGHGYSKRGMGATLDPAQRSALHHIEPAMASHAHNVVLNVLGQTGLAGLLLVIWLVVAQLRRWRACWRSADPVLHRIGLAGLLFLVALITKNLTDDFLQDPVSMLCWGWLGWLAGQQAQRQDALQHKAL